MTFLSTVSWVFFGAMIATALAIFPYRALAAKVGMVDHPDKVRKLQKQPVPVGGGFVVFFVMTTIMTSLIYFRDQIGFDLALSPQLLLPLIIISPFIIIVGLVDDMRGISGKLKLLCQIIAASVIIGFAKYYSVINYFDIELNLHHLFYPIAIFWIIGMVNAINLLDGADGVAVTVSFFMAVATACIAYINGHPGIALTAVGLAGSLLGFFLHNRPSAKIYLGDTGSMFIGMILATLMLRASVESERTICVCGPLAIALIPIVDSFFAVIRRINSGRTIFSPDRGHIHHLLSAKVSPYSVLLILSLLVLPGCIAAVVGTYLRNDYIPVAVSAVVLVFAAVTDLFGRRELFILFGRIKGRFRKWFHKDKYMRKNGEVYHIQGSGPWKAIWNRLIPLLREHPCKRVQLDINMPNRNEDFFGEWENVTKNDSGARMVFCSVSLGIKEHSVGTLRLYFDQRDYELDDLFHVISTISGICELSIKQYLDSGELDPAFTLLAFDSVVTLTPDADTLPVKRAA